MRNFNKLTRLLPALNNDKNVFVKNELKKKKYYYMDFQHDALNFLKMYNVDI